MQFPRDKALQNQVLYIRDRGSVRSAACQGRYESLATAVGEVMCCWQFHVHYISCLQSVLEDCTVLQFRSSQDCGFFFERFE